MLWPDSTSRTASFLNSSVYLPRCPFLIFVSLSLLKQLDKGYVLRGQGHTAKVAFRLKESLGDARKRSFEAYRRLSRLREGTPHQEPGVRGLYVPLLCRGGAH